ncbi:MAG TPA: ribonuclease PH [Candidatus Hydrogenedentes bacterium]|nr:ribonuclease PH [Candidatus Hydrogenedentota bacterium]HPG67096.1 ribonuclease PH [Candidatus Hydrogenedentota bacterium]
MRPDGRAPDVLRAVTIERGYLKHADGSARITCGDTHVICSATLEDRVPPFLRNSGRGWVTAEYAMMPRSAQERITRDSVKKGRALEISRLIGRSLRSVVDMALLGECQIILDCDVIQADGGTRTASVTGAYVALYDALDRVVRQGRIERIPIHNQCAAVSVGIVDGEPRLDLSYAEDAAAEVDMNLVMLADGTYIEIQGCAEGKPFSRGRMNELLDLAEGGIGHLFAIQNEALKSC